MADQEIRDAVLGLATQDPFIPITYGHGSFGIQCRFCLRDDYAGSVKHSPMCVWVVARSASGLEYE